MLLKCNSKCDCYVICRRRILRIIICNNYSQNHPNLTVSELPI